ncbi:MAG: DUF2190 domain-containing protein [Chelatococcus sp.]|nr:MAG: DUF2190 domain-containing protein [Chelatococcus sp.]
MAPVRASIDTLVITRIAASIVAQNKFVTFADAQAVLNDPVLGVSKLDATAGDALPVTVLGGVDMTAGGPIAKGDQVVSDANGNPIAKGANTNVAGRALNAAAANERVFILLISR